MGFFRRNRGLSRRTLATQNMNCQAAKDDTSTLQDKIEEAGTDVPAEMAAEETAVAAETPVEAGTAAVETAAAEETTVEAEEIAEAETAKPTAEAETAAEESTAEAVAQEREDTASSDQPAESGHKGADAVFHYFREIAAIPHGSHHTEQISDYLVKFAKQRGLSCVQDDTYNVIITKKASEGYEEAEPIALQGHMDMVLARHPDKKIDLLTEPVTILEDGDWIFADGTTLGADDGIAVAMMLAALDDNGLRHPLLECIFTSDEEVGLVGASAIDLTVLKSRRLLNLDSETEGVFCAGCAGGADVVCEMPLKRKKRDGRVISISVSGLHGGHSGCDIHLGGANAIRLLARALYGIYTQMPFRLISIEGGDANNAIPTNAEAKILVAEGDYDENIRQYYAEAGKKFADEYKFTDPDICWKSTQLDDDSADCVSKKKTRKILGYLMSLPTGITHLNPVIKGAPQTSLNMGTIRTFKDRLTIEFMVRSGINTQTAYLCDRIACIAEGFGAKTVIRSSYPAWEYRKDSPLRDLAVATYTELTGKEPKVEVIHAGLECGILSGKLPGLDCISAGPTVQNVHTIRERVSRSSVENVWTFLEAFLKKASQDTLN